MLLSALVPFQPPIRTTRSSLVPAMPSAPTRCVAVCPDLGSFICSGPRHPWSMGSRIHASRRTVEVRCPEIRCLPPAMRTEPSGRAVALCPTRRVAPGGAGNDEKGSHSPSTSTTPIDATPTPKASMSAWCGRIVVPLTAMPLGLPG